MNDTTRNGNGPGHATLSKPELTSPCHHGRSMKNTLVALLGGFALLPGSLDSRRQRGMGTWNPNTRYPMPVHEAGLNVL